jgi:DNA-binding response OmpR family regulator
VNRVPQYASLSQRTLRLPGCSCPSSAQPKLEIRSVLVIGGFSWGFQRLERPLRRRGVDILRLTSARRAMSLLLDSAFPVDLMIVDAIAPSASTLDLTADLANLRPSFPVLYIVGAEKSLLQCCLEAEAPDAVLAAPVRGAELIARIEALMAAPRSVSAA